MKLNDLIEAFASEIELAMTRLDHNLEQLATLDIESPAFMDALDQYSGQAQRMGEAAEMAGFPGLQAVCTHVVENSLMLATQPPGGRVALLAFLRAWPPLIVLHLRNLSDPSTAAGLVDHLRGAPMPMDEEEALKVMHMLGAMPLQVGLSGEGDAEPCRQELATPEDVALVMPDDVDRKFLEGFFQEAPDQARYLVNLARTMAAGEGDSSDVIAAKRVAHTLKGSGAIIGLRGIASLGHHLEDVLDYFEREEAQVTGQVANALLDAAYCLEQMIGFVTGTDDYPQQAHGVLQAVLDLANRIDAGEALDLPATRVASAIPATAAAAARLPLYRAPARTGGGSRHFGGGATRQSAAH